MQKIITSLIIVFLFVCCNKDSTSSGRKYTVSGYVFYINSPMENATVSIDNKANFTSYSNNIGYFEIKNVPEGEYVLIAKKTLPEGNFVESTSNISVNEDISIDNLKLPKGVIMHQPKDITDASVILSWSPTDANDFREYKIYRHTTSGLDEATGLLIHVSTSITDTTFINENLDPLTTYYFRVYVMNDFGRLGGSNIVSAKTENKNYIHNGDFETQENLFSWWDGSHWGQFIYTDSISISGNYSLLVIAEKNAPGEPADNFYANLSNYSVSDLVGNKNYKLSGWVKTDGEYSNYTGNFWGNRTEKAGFLFGTAPYILGISQNTEWTYVEKTFYLSDTDIYNFSLTIRSSCQYTWFDDIKLEIFE